MREMICIICPRGCHLKVDEQTLEVKGNSCPRGAEYGKNEVKNPVRTVTGTVKTSSGEHPALAVRTNRPVPKSKMLEVMSALHSFKADPPINRGDVLIKDVCGTGADVIACKTLG